MGLILPPALVGALSAQGRRPCSRVTDSKLWPRRQEWSCWLIPAESGWSQWEEGSPPGPGQTAPASQHEQTSTLAWRPDGLDGSTDASRLAQNALGCPCTGSGDGLLLLEGSWDSGVGVHVALWLIRWPPPSAGTGREVSYGLLGTLSPGLWKPGAWVDTPWFATLVALRVPLVKISAGG